MSAFGRNALRALVELRAALGDVRMNGNWLAAITTLALIGGVSESLAQQKMYWSHNDIGDHKMQRADLNGNEVEDFLIDVIPRALAIDRTSGWLYWTGNDGIALFSGIHRIKLDGTQALGLVITASAVTGIALDLAGGKMYWTEPTINKIRRADLNGSAVEDLITTGLDRPWSIALDVADGRMYWTEVGEKFFQNPDGSIHRADLDGTNRQELVTGIDEPVAFALDIQDGKMYWSDPAIPSPAIQRANLDGTGVQGVVLSPFPPSLVGPVGITLDLSERRMYLAGIAIARADLDGSNAVVILDSTARAAPCIALDLCGRPVGGLRFPDHVAFVDCLTGPASFASTPCHCSDFSGDVRVDLKDYALLQRTFTTDE